MCNGQPQPLVAGTSLFPVRRLGTVYQLNCVCRHCHSTATFARRLKAHLFVSTEWHVPAARPILLKAALLINIIIIIIIIFIIFLQVYKCLQSVCNFFAQCSRSTCMQNNAPYEHFVVQASPPAGKYRATVLSGSAKLPQWVVGFPCVFAARRYASAAYAVMRCPYVCLSVCLCVCHVHEFCQNE